MTTASILWRRLDVPGHDACRLAQREDGWEIAGTAVFRHEAGPAQLAYRVTCDPGWRARRGEVRGWLAAQPVEIAVARTADGRWTVNGVLAAGLERYVDLDLGFTPSTNLIQLRRLGLAEGEAADAPAAWMDVPDGALQALAQRYERRTAATYWYESPSAGYAALLEVTPDGFVRKYPGLWEADP